MVCKLREIRVSRRMTQEQLATASGVNRVSIAKYETGKTIPSLLTAEKLASALGVTVNDLIETG